LAAGVVPGFGAGVLGNGLVKIGAAVGFAAGVDWAGADVGLAAGAGADVPPGRAVAAGGGVRRMPGAPNAGVGVGPRTVVFEVAAGAARAGDVATAGGVGVGGS